jgi:hypothetical protein
MLVVFNLYAYLLGDTEVSVFSRAIASSCQEWSNSSVRFKILAHVNKQSSLPAKKKKKAQSLLAN